MTLAQAYERSQRQQGEGDAAATAIYADAYSESHASIRFCALWKRMTAC